MIAKLTICDLVRKYLLTSAMVRQQQLVGCVLAPNSVIRTNYYKIKKLKGKQTTRGVELSM